VNQALNRPVHGRLALTERFLTAIVSNSFGALITLALNGYGHDAVRIARGMYEAAVNATFLEQHPEEIDDYLDFFWVKQKRLSDYLQANPPSGFSLVHVERIAEIDAEFDRVANRFKNRQGRLRNSWSAKSIRVRAEKVGLGELYPTFYGYATGIHHGDVSGLVSQSAKDDRTPIVSGHQET
jgi:hypothetical protein